MAERKKREKFVINTTVTPNTWKAIATAFVMAVADVANALRDIAVALEDRK